MASTVLNLEGDLPLETTQLVRSARSWGERELEPLIAKHWEDGTFPPNILESFQRNCPQLLGYPIPQKYGGAGYNLLTACHISRALASIDASFTTALLVQYGLCCESILLCGTEEQKQKLVPSLSRLQITGCFCLTEPQSGSDASDLRTTATKVHGGYSITGSKRWIGNALTSEVYIAWARNTSLPGSPVMGFIVQKSQQENSMAIQTTKIEGKISMRMVQNANVEFNKAFCPDDNVMSDHVGFGESVARVLEASRVSVAWIPVGICQGALEKTIGYTTKRDAFGSMIASNQLMQEKLVRATAMASSMYLLVERVTKDFMQGKCSLPAVSMVKAYNTKLGREVVAICRESLGGNGILLDHGIASKFCDIESTYTYEGTYDVCTLVCGRALTGISAIKSSASVTKRNGKPNSRL